MKKNNKKGFTIVELVIVIAVIGILAAVLIPTFGNIIADAKQSAVEQEAMNIYKQGYALDIIDGVIDNETLNDSGQKVDVNVSGYSAPNNVPTAEVTDGTYKAKVVNGVLSDE